MNMNQINYFLAVVKYKTFTNAAEELYISQSSLSKQIKALEEELGYKLFSRDNKENSLTAEGEFFLEYAKDFSRNYARLISNLHNFHRQRTKKSITLGILPVIYEYNIHNDLAIFQSLIASSNVYVNLLEGSQKKLLNLLHNRKLDSVIVRTDCLDMSNYIHSTIQEEELLFIYSDKIMNYDESAPITLSEISRHPLIIFDESSSLYQSIGKLFMGEQVQPEFTYIYQRHEQILSMVNAGFGVSIMPEGLISRGKYPFLKMAKLSKTTLTRTSLIRLKDMPVSETLDLLFKFFDSTKRE